MTLRQIVIVGSGLGLIVIAWVTAGWLASMKEPPEIEEQPQLKKYVRTTPVTYKDINTKVVAFGRVRTAESLDLISEVAGRMYRGAVPLKEGQNFRKGTLLFSVDDKEKKLNLQSQKSTFLKDLAAILPDLKIDYNTNFSAWDNYFKSINIEAALPPLPNYKSNKERTFLATKNIYSSYYTIKSAEEQLRKHRFYAPFSGSISQVSLQSGSFVNPGNVIGRIIRTGSLELKVDVGLDDIAWIKTGEPVQVISEEGQSQWEGNVLRIGEYVNQNTQSIDVHIAITPNGNPLYDGQYLRAEIQAKTVKDGMYIPRNAIFNKNEVFILEDTLLRVKSVKIHRLEETNAVFSGIPKGKKLVVEPVVNGHNGMVAYQLSEGKGLDLERKKSANSEIVN